MTCPSGTVSLSKLLYNNFYVIRKFNFVEFLLHATIPRFKHAFLACDTGKSVLNSLIEVCYDVSCNIWKIAL